MPKSPCAAESRRCSREEVDESASLFGGVTVGNCCCKLPVCDEEPVNCAGACCHGEETGEEVGEKLSRLCERNDIGVRS